MKTQVFAALVALIAAPAFAEPSCTPGAEAAPVWEAIKSFEEEGGTVIAFKINDGGCYEILRRSQRHQARGLFRPQHRRGTRAHRSLRT